MAGCHPGALFTDGAVLGACFALLLLFTVARQLRGARAWQVLALLAIVAAGVGLRLALSPVVPQGAWHYTRFLPAARLLVEGCVLRQLVPRFWVEDVIYRTNLVIACAMPLVVFAHTSLFFRDRAVALAVAALVAVLPLHLRFSRSDDFFVQLIALNSLSFCLVHLAIEDPAAAVRVVAGAAAPLVAVAAFATRPLGFVFGPFLAAVPWLLYGDEIPRRRKQIITAAMAVATLYDLVFHIFDAYRDQVRDALSLETIVHALVAFVSPLYNPLLDTIATPPVMTALAVYAVVVLRARGDGRRAWFIVAWAGFFFATTSYVLVPVAAFQNRYHQHIVEPFVLLAGVGLVELLRRRRRLGLAALALAAASPALHRAYITDVDYIPMREFTFLRRLRDRGAVPAGCTVLEYTGPAGYEWRDGSRWLRLGEYVRAGRRGAAWGVVSTGGDWGARDPVSAEARRALAAPGRCLMLYEGSTCYGSKRLDDVVAPACAALRRELRTTVIATEEIPNLAYDANESRGYERRDVADVRWDGRLAGAPPSIRLSLLRVEGAGP